MGAEQSGIAAGAAQGWQAGEIPANCVIAARAAVLAQAEALVLDAAPIIPIYYNTHVYMLHPAVKGWQPTPTDHSDFRYVWLEAPK